MKKEYKKPELLVLDFSLTESIMTEEEEYIPGGSLGTDDM